MKFSWKKIGSDLVLKPFASWFWFLSFFIVAYICWRIQFDYRVLSDGFFVFVLSYSSEVLFVLCFMILFGKIFHVLESLAVVKTILLVLKVVSLVLLVPSFLLSGILVLNDALSKQPLIKQSGKVISISQVDIPFVDISYGWMKVRMDFDQTLKMLLLSPGELGDFWAAEDIVLSVRQGVLGLKRVLLLDQDQEKYSRNILQISPKSSVAMKTLISLYISDSNFNDLVDTARKYNSFYPKDFSLLTDIGGALAASRHYQEAIEFLSLAILDDQNYEAYRLLGWTLSYSGIDRKRAAQMLLKAIEINPYEWTAYYNLGYTYMAMGDCINQKAMWEKVLSMQPNFPEVENFLSMCKCAE